MAIAVIPARYSATRLPGKPLVSLAGKPMIQRVWERARQAERISRVIIATDDERILKAAAGFGAEAVMTRSEHRSGTERVAEVAVHIAGEGEEVFVNVQGDETRWSKPLSRRMAFRWPLSWCPSRSPRTSWTRIS
jgi:3-deoxy-manno-octulosonate cytidylyltransferase (CMP-KDO synthetase)